jgi:mono/diheme cytochrome c family protein
MNRLMRYILYIITILGLTAAGITGYLMFLLPNTGPAPDITIEITEERVERGRYLAHHVMLCMDCHAVRDFSLFSGPPFPETLGAGGEVFDQSIGLPGRFISRNITPDALGNWTDGEVFRAITSGVSKDGSALFPLMPYHHYAQLDEEDLAAIYEYLRTIEPVDNRVEIFTPAR